MSLVAFAGTTFAGATSGEGTFDGDRDCLGACWESSCRAIEDAAEDRPDPWLGGWVGRACYLVVGDRCEEGRYGA